MAERSTGPVKPPVIDLTARSGTPRRDPAGADQESSDTGTSRRTGASTRPAPGWRAGRWPLLGGVALGGAVLGTILTYLMALAVPLPSRTVLPPDLSGDVAAQGERVGHLETDLTALKGSAAKTQVSLDATIVQIDKGLGELRGSISDVRSAIPAPQTVDLGPLQGELQTLRSRIDAMGAGASGTDAEAIAQSLSAVQTSLGALTQRLNGVDAGVASLRTDLDAARKSLADHISTAMPDEIGPALKLPLILSGLESALATGRPFADELTSLHSVLPDFAIPDDLMRAGPEGLSRPDTLLAGFEAALPAMLAAQDSGSSGDWQQNALDWAKSLLALRPAGEVDGSAPDAVISRLEGAMGRRDYITAATLLDQLPTPMRDAGGTVATDIRTHAAAERLLTDLRARALAATEAAS